jgi:predicted CoA-binding protein
MPTTLEDVREFLALRRIALVGLSRDPKDFSRMLFREMCQRGYDMVPVNPAAGELENRRCFHRIPEIDPPAEGALIMTAPEETDRVVRDCAEAGVQRVWMHRGGGQGAVSKDAADFCHQNGIRLVEGYCPFMFLTSTSFVHRLHGFVLKVLGRYPAHGAGRCESPRTGSNTAETPEERKLAS